MTGEITLPISEQAFWGLIGFAGIIFALLLVFGVMIPTGSRYVAPLELLKGKLGLERLNSGLFFIALMIWGIVSLLLCLGLIWLIWQLIWSSMPVGQTEIWDWRFALAKLAALTATLGAVVVLPMTLVRLGLTRKQTETASEALFNEKINAASDDLHAMRQRWEGGKNIWEADVVRRNTAIDRLEGLANQGPDEVPRITRMLSVYVREMSKEVPPEPVPENASSSDLRKWVKKLAVKRSDMQMAVQALGRLRKVFAKQLATQAIDLSGANLQAMMLSHDDYSFEGVRFHSAQMQGVILTGARMQEADLSFASFQGALLSKARMQKTYLVSANLEGAYLADAELQDANLGWAKMSRAILRSVKLQGADLRATIMDGTDLHTAELQGTDLSGSKIFGARITSANMNGAYLNEIEMDKSTNLTGTSLRGASIRLMNCVDLETVHEQLDQIFGDATVILAGGVKPNHTAWPSHFLKEAMLDTARFKHAWRAWQISIGFDPEHSQR